MRLVGGKAYAKSHKNELEKHDIAAESDFGAGRIYQIDDKVSDSALEAILAFSSPMADNGVKLGRNTASGGPDVSMLPKQGVPVASDGHEYFDCHPTPNNTLDKIDPMALQQTVAAYAQFAYMMAQSDIELRPLATGVNLKPFIKEAK